MEFCKFFEANCFEVTQNSAEYKTALAEMFY